jgi:uncharacterized membrane protein YkvA (DUF1232 family)
MVVPFKAKLMMLGAVAYLVSPIDLIPDLLVGPGILDDALVVPGLFLLAMRSIFEASRKQPASAKAVKRTNYRES